MEYDFDDMSKSWLGVKRAFEAYRSAGTDERRNHFHTNLIRQLDYFFKTYPNPFGEDPDFTHLEIHEAVASAHDRSDYKSRVIRAKALLADIDRTIDHKRKRGAGKEELDRLRSQRSQTLIKIDALVKKTI
jgi:hypothetical protein